MINRIGCAVLAALMLTSAVSCSKKNKTKEVSKAVPNSEIVEETIETATEPPKVEETGVNPLTGESGYNPSANGKRPVAVMVNNIKAALPQYGISEADIIYEVPVEGGITRLMAVYADYTNVPNVCSVRSCRYYYPQIALGLDAIYCHWGSDQTIALETLNRTGIDHLDGSSESGLFYRDESRVGSYASEHTGYLCGAELPEHIASHGFRTDVNSEYIGGGLDFAGNGEEAVINGLDCSTLTLNFSDQYFSTFDYNAESGSYFKQHSGSPHMDGVTGEQLNFDNVFALQTSVYTGADGYLMNVELIGEGVGYYASKGKIEQIKWKKESEYAPINLYDENGAELKLNIGESYFGIIGTNRNISFN